MEWMRRVRYVGRGVVLPSPSWCSSLPAPPCVQQPRRLSEPRVIQIFMEASSLRHGLLISSVFSLCPFTGEWQTGLKIPSVYLDHYLIFLVTSPHPAAYRLTSLEQKTLLSLRRFQRIQQLCVRNWGQGPNIRTKDAPGASVIQEITSILGVLCQEPGAKTNIHIFSQRYICYI